MVPKLVEAMLPGIDPARVPLNQQAVMVPTLLAAMPPTLPLAVAIVPVTEQAVRVP